MYIFLNTYLGLGGFCSFHLSEGFDTKGVLQCAFPYPSMSREMTLAVDKML